METEGFPYDEIAEKFFSPIYPVIAEAILEKTGVGSGRLLDLGCGGGASGIRAAETRKLFHRSVRRRQP